MFGKNFPQSLGEKIVQFWSEIKHMATWQAPVYTIPLLENCWKAEKITSRTGSREQHTYCLLKPNVRLISQVQAECILTEKIANIVYRIDFITDLALRAQDGTCS